MQATCMTPSTPTGRHAIDTMALLLGWHSGSQAARAAMKSSYLYTSCCTYICILLYDIDIQMSQDIPWDHDDNAWQLPSMACSVSYANIHTSCCTYRWWRTRAAKSCMYATELQLNFSVSIFLFILHKLTVALALQVSFIFPTIVFILHKFLIVLLFYPPQINNGTCAVAIFYFLPQFFILNKLVILLAHDACCANCNRCDK